MRRSLGFISGRGVSMSGFGQLLLCVGAAACGWLTEPSDRAPRPPRAATQHQEDPQGCRKVRFTIVGDTAVIAEYRDSTCGMQLELVTAGAMSWSGDTVAIPFRLRNHSPSSVLLPVRLEVRDSGIVALEPEEAPTTDVVPLNMDSTLSGGRWLWLVGEVERWQRETRLPWILSCSGWMRRLPRLSSLSNWWGTRDSRWH